MLSSLYQHSYPARPFTLEDINSYVTAVFQLLKLGKFLVMTINYIGEEDLKFRMLLVQKQTSICCQILGAISFLFSSKLRFYLQFFGNSVL